MGNANRPWSFRFGDVVGEVLILRAVVAFSLSGEDRGRIHHVGMQRGAQDAVHRCHAEAGELSKSGFWMSTSRVAIAEGSASEGAVRVP